MLNVILALLEHKDIITKKEADKLAKELKNAMMTDRYEDAQRLIQRILE
jgi:hypothetical protein